MNSKDSIVYTDEYYSLYDEEEGEVEFHMVAREFDTKRQRSSLES